MVKDRLNIIVPIYNPHNGWEANFIQSMLDLETKLTGTDFTVILVNDGSTINIEQIGEIKEQFGYLRYISYPVNMGKGYAIKYGISASSSDYYIYTDMDFPFGTEILLHTFRLLKHSKTNIVVGTRNDAYFRNLPFKRRMLPSLLKKLSYFTTGFKIRDTQAGLKGLDNTARKILTKTKTNSFIFELEFLKYSLKQGLSYEFIDVNPRPGIIFTDFSIQIILKEFISLLKIIF